MYKTYGKMGLRHNTQKLFGRDTLKKNRNLIKNNSTVLHKLNEHFTYMTLYLERHLQFVMEAKFPRPSPCVGEGKKQQREKSERKVR